VVVFSGAASEADINRAYELGANAYVTKPADVDEHLSTLKAISEYWLSGERIPQ
jgi:chemotaxis family two-component system response regulator Rcp1